MRCYFKNEKIDQSTKKKKKLWIQIIIQQRVGWRAAFHNWFFNFSFSLTSCRYKLTVNLTIFWQRGASFFFCVEEHSLWLKRFQHLYTYTEFTYTVYIHWIYMISTHTHAWIHGSVDEKCTIVSKQLMVWCEFLCHSSFFSTVHIFVTPQDSYLRYAMMELFLVLKR